MQLEISAKSTPLEFLQPFRIWDDPSHVIFFIMCNSAVWFYLIYDYYPYELFSLNNILNKVIEERKYEKMFNLNDDDLLHT